MEGLSGHTQSRRVNELCLPLLYSLCFVLSIHGNIVISSARRTVSDPQVALDANQLL